jgi:hypothetical protein
MKSILSFIVVLLVSSTLFGQEQNTQNSSPVNSTHLPGDVSVSVTGNLIMNDPYGSQFAGGIKLRMFIGERVSFDSDFVLGKDYTHFGPGIIGLPLWILGTGLGFSTDEDGSFAWFLFKLAVMALSAEHVAYHFPVGNTTDISPYISVLRFKQLNINDNLINPEDNYARTSFAAGVELNKYFNRFVLSPYAEYNITYDGYLRGFNFGLSFGYYIPAKK